MKEKVLLVAVKLPEQDLEDMHYSLAELGELCRTAGVEVTDTVIQARQKPDLKTFLGKGKLEEISLTYDKAERDVLVFNHELSPTQVRNIEEVVDSRVLTRSQLIMDIFAIHARSRVSRLQVELAQLQYNMTRLTKKWTHLSRTQGGIGIRGPGETQLESDRREAAQRIHILKEKLKKVEQQMQTQRKQRYKEFQVAIIGYTNAGKSTLLNQLVKEEVYAQDQLFATLDTTTRKLWLGEGVQVLISDTVGFIRDLPPGLVDSFHSTLEDVIHADLLLHLVDVGAPDMKVKLQAVADTIKAIHAQDVMQVMCFNKCDTISEKDLVSVRMQFPEALYISAREGLNIEVLKQVISHHARNKKGS